MLRPALIGLLLASAWSPLAARAAETLRYTVLVDGGKPAGHQVVQRADDGSVHVDFVFKDNGRGPELKEDYTLAADGTFATYAVKGTSTFGAPVDESFRVENGVAHWKSTSDEGEQPLSDGAAYWSLGGTPQSGAQVLSALLARGDNRLPLIPGGALSARAVADVTLGGDRKVRLMRVTGVGFTPQFVWMTADAQPRFYALIVPGYLQVLEEGREADGAVLEARQKQAEDDALTELRDTLAHPLRGATLIRNARVFDSETATVGPASDLLIANGRIVSISGAGQEKAAVEQTIDAGGRVLTPGLFDMHGHISAWQGGLHLAAGVTTVRDMGNDNATLQQLIADEREGRVLSPSIVPAGFIEGESPMSARNGFVISDLDGAKKAIDWYASHGYPQIKIYNSFPKDILRDTVAYAHSRDLRVSGHIPVYLRAQDALDAGYDEIQHINQVLLNFLVKDDTDTRTLERFYLPAREVAGMDFDAKPVQDFIARLARDQIAIDPTLATFDFIRQRPGQLSEAYAAVADHLPPDVRRGLKTAEFDIPDDTTAARYRKSYDKMVDFVGRMYRAGVPILAGTDATPGFALQRELALYVQAGMTPSQALQVATLNAAKYSRTLNDRGTVAVGKRADLVLFDGDPTVDIGDLRRVALVIKNGEAYYPAEIDRALGIEPFAEPVRAVPAGDAAP
ncbi:MAG: amidohydrolase family protein [Xanthomonadales bacterium]|nr:amidohydrolase family protein [Xanthomonadales bacterium]